ncbi:transporter substrate-binding domain-containing protein [Vibrio sp. SCSIO 43136]|uniref:transporter substrate-binding domain-containing protein n=1 Tax=Vibrio sp. SCSIO 43136 TaxID=2819101 RepID=UPI0020752E63|nr:transporter substrate-binding domain-containing protein [Vibrio sp. SCSIO 43136]USD67331.1 transporter substrate-binding domain-containing protein [Vibrio sp. SCSIO 43136]
MMRKIILFFIFIFSGLVSAQEPLTFYVVHYPPYMIVNSDNEISGMDVEVVAAAFQESGQEVKFDVLPWKRVMKLMQVGEVAGGLSCSKRKGREKYMLFSEYISTTRQTAITRKETQTEPINNLNDLAGYSVTTIAGWGATNKLEAHGIEYLPSKDMRSALVSVLHRGVDVFYGPEIPTMHIAKKMQSQENLKVTYIEDVASISLHLCVSKPYPNSEQIVTSFNRGLQAIKQNGTYETIQRKYF